MNAIIRIEQEVRWQPHFWEIHINQIENLDAGTLTNKVAVAIFHLKDIILDELHKSSEIEPG